MARIEQSIEVNVPLHAVYNQWTQFEEFPRFMEGVREVRQLDDAHLHWRADRNGREVEWDSEITDQVPDQRIAWRDISGPGNTGSISFQPVQPGKTRVHISMLCEPAVAPSEAAHAEQMITHRVEQDLARFKKMLEAQGGESGAWRGEIHGSQPVPSDGDRTSDATNGVTGKTVGQTDRERQEAGPARSSAPPMSGSTLGAGIGEQPGPGTAQGFSGQQQPQQQQARRQDDIGNTASGTSTKASGPQTWLPNLLQAWEEPLVVMRRVTGEMDQLFERFIGRPVASRLGQSQGGEAGKWMPPVEVVQRDNRLVVMVDLPGIKQEDVQIEINNGKLTIEGERREQNQQAAAEGYRRSERSYGPFYRMIPLPDGVDPDSAQASMHNGVLEITIPMPTSEARRGRRIDIQPPR